MSTLILPNQLWIRNPSLMIHQEEERKAIHIVKEEIDTPSHRWHYYLPTNPTNHQKEIPSPTKYD